MGIGNVKAVIANWSGLPHTAFRVMVQVAVTIHDDDPDPIWRGKWERLTVVLDRKVPDNPRHERGCRCDVCKARNAAYEAVKHAVEHLTRAGAFELVVRPRSGQKAEYRVNLQGTRCPAVQGTACPAQGGTRCPAVGGMACPPKEDVEGLPRGIPERNEGEPQAGTSPAPVDEYAKASKILAQLPDLGATHLAQVDHIDNLTERVIAAARLARAAPVPSQGGPPAR